MDAPSHRPIDHPSAWSGFARTFVVAAAIMGLAAIGLVAAIDPYGLRAAPGRPPGPIMDTNQRLSYPQIARGGPVTLTDEKVTRSFHIGRWGEELVAKHFSSAGTPYEWVNEEAESGLPFDIRLQLDTQTVYVEVKTTVSEDRHVFPISGQELSCAQDNRGSYW